MMRNFAKCVLVIAATGMLGLVGCGKSEDGGTTPASGETTTGSKYGAESATLNSICPISGDPVEDGFTVDFGGKTVGFCCNDCVKKWEGMDDMARTKMMSTLDAGKKSVADEHGDHEGHDDH